MDTKLVFLLVFSALIILPAQSAKHGHGHGHGHWHGHGHGHGHGPGEGKSGKHDSKESDYDYEATDPPSDEDIIDWLIDLQDLSDECNPNPCLNNGVCEAKNDKFKCDCPKPFKGKTCQKVKKVCKRNKCGHGQCVLTSTEPYFECKCKPPFQPPDCRKVSVCDPSPCKNGASCIADGHKFECACPDSFSGKFCQVGPDDCSQGDGDSYRGLVSETEDGDDCLFWNSYFILDKGADPFNTYDDDDGLGPHNHCRNPDGDIKPWCFINRRGKLKWDHCDVKECPTPTAVPPAEEVTSPAPGEEVTSPPPGEEVTSPAPGEEVTSPAPGEEVTSSAPGEEVTSPAPGEEVTSPAPGEEVISPAPGEEVTSSAPGEEVTSPAPGEEVTVPGVVEEKPTTAVKEFASCGKPEPTRLLHRVYGGMKSIPGAHPWQASLQVRPKGSHWPYRHTCGGVLIEPCWVLTAGHCIDKANSMRVVLGGVKLAKNESSEQTVDVEAAIVHENYRETPSAVYNDIALLKLKGPDGHCTKETKFVKTACLPNTTFPAGKECTISGWGSTETSDYGSNQLLDAKVLLISQQQCMSDRVYGHVLDDTMFCAGYLQGGVDSCQGDSGGPLVCENDEVHYVYGLVSWGDSCAKKYKPGVYTRLTKFTDWINSHIHNV
ncbi:hypothetical protein SKAU_G00178670 [Synaphobranchus kaupii]|uniref:trypsin n=1 Tax=Synaphobranchus kaupii TaxID=118154 RepID=A0A9Q1FLR1_SYNKA|nr:hypothetical protein SKAU_G00178670 [Synaphobranchus kaupii]